MSVVPSLEGLRLRLLDSLRSRCERTGMWTNTAAAAAASWRELLSTLAYIDGCEEDFQALVRQRQSADFGPLGAESMGRWFTSASSLNGNAETTAWFAELACTFGWLKVTPLSMSDWARVLSVRTERFPASDIARQEWVETFPSPSLLVDRRVYCYSPPPVVEGRWAYVDIQLASHGRTDSNSNEFVRSLRFPGRGHMYDRMAVLPAAQPMLST